MNKKDRGRHQRATNEGRYAFILGLELSANPYKVSPWGVGGAWVMGWQGAKHEKEQKRIDWEKQLSRMLLCQYGFDLATFRKVTGESILNHLYNLYPDNPQTLLDDFDFTTEIWQPYYTPDGAFATE